MDKAGVKDPQVLDKSYWIQRVGEVCCVTEQALPLPLLKKSLQGWGK